MHAPPYETFAARSPRSRANSSRTCASPSSTRSACVRNESTQIRIAKRPRNHVLVDYNQNAWGRTLASVYSPRPKPRATVSTPLTWDELRAGATIDDFRIDNVPARLAKLGDLWAPLAAKGGRFDLSRLFA